MILTGINGACDVFLGYVRGLIQASANTHRCIPLRKLVHDTALKLVSPGRTNSTRDNVALGRLKQFNPDSAVKPTGP
jgi:hypothetical protein